MTENFDDYASIQDLIKDKNISPMTVRFWIADKKIKAIKKGSHIFVNINSFNEFWKEKEDVKTRPDYLTRHQLIKQFEASLELWNTKLRKYFTPAKTFHKVQYFYVPEVSKVISELIEKGILTKEGKYKYENRK